MSQSRAASLVEALANVAVGYAMAVATQLAVFPLFGLHVPLANTLAIGAIFTAVSIARSYCLRRLFNALGRTRPQNLATTTALHRSRRECS